MNYYCCHKRQWVMLLLLVSIIVTPFIPASDAKEKASSLQFTAHSDETFSVKSHLTPLEALLSKITETTNVVIYIDNALKKRPVTIDVKRSTLVQLLQHIAGDNYAIVYDKHNVTALHVLPPGKSRSIKSAVAVSEFSGKVKISKNRAQMFFMPPDHSKDAIDDYIKKRHAALKKLAEEEPNKAIQAQMSFQGYMSDKRVVALVKENKLDVVTLNMGWKEHGGGHDMQEGESIEAAMESVVLYQKKFLSVLLEDADRQVAGLRQQGISDAQMKAELEFQKEAHDLSSVFHNKGLTFYGMRVAASAKQLHTLTASEETIRLVDPLWGGSVEDEIADAYSVAKIAIPLVPEKETFIP